MFQTGLLALRIDLRHRCSAASWSCRH